MSYNEIEYKKCQSCALTFRPSITACVLQACGLKARAAAAAADVRRTRRGEDQYLLPLLSDADLLHVQSVRKTQGLWRRTARQRLYEKEGIESYLHLINFAFMITMFAEKKSSTSPPHFLSTSLHRWINHHSARNPLRFTLLPGTRCKSSSLSLRRSCRCALGVSWQVFERPSSR